MTQLLPKKTMLTSTKDNYQGEESDIVLVSMTRSNKSHDIGFMSAPERLNVLLSRARDGLIMIGNSETFMNARKGKDVWRKLFDLLKENDHIYEGFPVKCEKHPDRTAMLSSPEAFDSECPDGGCKEPWYVKKLPPFNVISGISYYGFQCPTQHEIYKIQPPTFICFPQS